MTENAWDLRPLAMQWQRRGGHHHGLVLTSNRRLPSAQGQTVGRVVVALDQLLKSASRDPPPSDRELWL